MHPYKSSRSNLKPNSKLTDCEYSNLQFHIRRQLSPLTKIIIQHEADNKNINKRKVRKSQAFLKSTRYTSPNSYQSSEIVSKKQSWQKNSMIKKSNKDNCSSMLGLGVKKKTKVKIISNLCKWKQ